ncbi:hypothetical protein [Georgenia sp. SYP-B2076]|uniref:hypothetical protein n=1 Tax=Georgenia sp. SYP-B2076 TaxID=2495881 RepID=UPI000F8DE1D7|nr:hypothetical protein [Georgenia sp. SYP-B2076]
MTRRIISAVLIVAGLVAIALAIASATVWRPSSTATLSLPSRPDTPVVVSDAGVLDAVAPKVTITATAGDGEPVVLAIGRTEDVDAWVGGSAHTRITGLASWDELRVAPGKAPSGAAPAESANVPSPAGSDLWVSEKTGTGKAELRWDDTPGRWSLLAATDGTAPAPEITLRWPVTASTPWLVPGVIVGAVLLLAGLALLVLDRLTRREAERRAAAAAAREAETAELPVSGAGASTAGMTRRQLREHERGEAQARRGRRGVATGEIPVVAAQDAEEQTAEQTAVPSNEVAPDGPPAISVAGAARGAGIVPASSRAAQFRRVREERTDTSAADAVGATAVDATSGAPGPAPVGAKPEVTPADAAPGTEADAADAGVARGGVVPALSTSAQPRKVDATPAAPEDVTSAAAPDESVAGDAAQDGREAPGVPAAAAEAVGGPVTEKMEPVSGPVTEKMEPVSGPVTEKMEPVSGPVTEKMEPVSGPVTEKMEPVGGPAKEKTEPVRKDAGPSAARGEDRSHRNEPDQDEPGTEEEEGSTKPDWRSMWRFGRKKDDDTGDKGERR